MGYAFTGIDQKLKGLYKVSQAPADGRTFKIRRIAWLSRCKYLRSPAVYLSLIHISEISDYGNRYGVREGVAVY